ncbi:MAG: hypothetical protein IJV45_04065 [Prevotella sp.]|nr:hypothetical protein [Prevotella sp.]
MLLHLPFCYYLLPSLQGGAGGGSCFAQTEQGDVTISVTPVQSVLPPQAGKYIDNLGRYFKVTVINNTDVQQNLYFGVQIHQKFPDEVAWMSTRVETMHMPHNPIVLAPNQHKSLNSIELKHLFDHYTTDDIFIREGRYRNILDSEFGLLDEGQYELQLSAYRWDAEATTPVTLNNQTDGLCLFNICYEAEPPMFTNPTRNTETDWLTDLAVTRIDKNQAQIKFDWTQPTLNCNATMVQFRYRIRFVELGSMMPDEAMEENTITFLEKNDLLTNTYSIPTAYVTQMIADTAYLGKIYAMQVTAYTPYQNENSLNVTMIKNEGKSDIFLFQLYDPTKKPATSSTGKTVGDAETNSGPLYIFEQPTLTTPQFPENRSRLKYVGDSIKVDWRKAWFVGGKGERQDTVDFKYTVALYTGNSADSREVILKTSKPLYEKSTTELSDTIKWDKIKDKVRQGDYLLLRVTAKPTNKPDSIFQMKGDSLNIIDFALTNHFDEDYQCGRENIQVANKTSIDKVPDKNRSIKIGQFYLTLDGPEPVTFNAKDSTFTGKGWIRWSPKADNYFNMDSRVAVKFEGMKINTDYEVYEGRCVTYPYSEGNAEFTDAQFVDSLFSLSSLDEIYGALELPSEVRSLVNAGVNEWGDDIQEATQSLAKSYNLGKYYTTYKRGAAKWEDFKHGDVFDLYFPLELPEEISKFLPKRFNVQIGSMQFTPQSAQMNLIAEIALPNSDVFEGQDMLIFGAPRLCITPDKFFPEEGVLSLLSNLPLKDPSSDFKMTFKAPTEPLDPSPGDGCFMRWDRDGFAGLGMHIAITLPNTKRVVSDKTTDVPALLDLKTVIECDGGGDAMDFIATGSLTPFEATDLPGWRFHVADEIIFDYNLSDNDRDMPTISQIKNFYAPMTYDEEKKKFVPGGDNSTFDPTLCGAYVKEANWDAWQGVYIKKVEIEFPKFAVFGSGEHGAKIGGENMIIDASGISCRVYGQNLLDAQTGKCGGWKFTLDQAYVDIVQNNFDNCTITGGFGVPLLGKVAQEKAGDEAGKKSQGKGSSSGSSGGKGNNEDTKQETDIDYFCQIRHMTTPGTKTYTVQDKDGNKVTKTRKQYDKDRLSYVFTTQNADQAKLGLNFFLADLTLLPGQTYFLVESVDADPEKNIEADTQVELCMAGDITIAGIDGEKAVEAQSSFAKRVKELNDNLSLPLKLPGIHFAKMRLSNRELAKWRTDLTEKGYQVHQEGLDQQEQWENENKKLVEFTEGKELKLGTDCYFNYGEWSLASAQKKIGPFTFGLKEFAPSMDGDNLTLDVEGMLGLMDGKFDVSAGIQISAQLHKEGSFTDWYLSDGKVQFKSIELKVDWEVFKFEGRLDIEDSSTDKGYGGSIKLEVKELFSLDVQGGYYNHKGISTEEKNKKIADAKLRAKREDGSESKYTKYYDPGEDFFSWGYFLITVGGQGLRIDPVVINRITGGFYYNTQPVMGKKDEKGHPVYDAKPTAKYGTIGVVFGIGITTSGGEKTVQGDLDVVVIYDKKNNRMTHFEFNGEIDAVGGIIHSKASLIYENNDVDRYLCLNLTVTTGLDSDKLVQKLTGISTELAAVKEELGVFQSQVDGVLMKKPSTAEMKGTMKEVESDYTEKTSKSDEKKTEENVSEGAKKTQASYGKSEVYLELKFTYRENSSNYTPTKWHLYLGEPKKEKRCKFTVIDYKDQLGIVSVNIGADAYLCVGNELPGNGELPEIPSEITEFLNGHKNSAVSTGADMNSVNNARSEVIKKMLSNAGGGGGVMLGASAWGFINIDLGLFYGYLKAIAGFDVSLVKYSTPQYCANYGSYMGKNGWYAMGQLYAYLAAKFGLHIKLGKLIDEKIDLVDAGIGGVFKMGLPKPTWFEGQARVKVCLLGGLVKIDKGFNFSGGTKCVPFRGNALDDFNLFGDFTVASDSIQEGWDEANAVSVKDATNIQFNTYANLGERYRLYDPTTGGDLSEEYGYSEAEMNLYASRTYIFDINKDRVLSENSKANINDCLGAVLYEIDPNTIFKSIRLMPSYYTQSNVSPLDKVYFQDMFFKKSLWNNRIMSRWMKSEKLESQAKETMKYEFENDDAMRAVKQWEGGYEYQGSTRSYNSYSSLLNSYKVEGGVTIKETTGRNFHITLPKLKPGKLYILELNGQAFEVLNGKRVWTKMNVETYNNNKHEEEMHSEYVRWEQKRLVYFRTKSAEQEVIPEHLNDIQPYVALAYPSVGKNQLFSNQADIEVNKAYNYDAERPTIALNTDIRSSFANGTLEWELYGWSRWNYTSYQGGYKAHTTQKRNNKWVTSGGGVSMQPESNFDLSDWAPDKVFNIKLKHTYQIKYQKEVLASDDMDFGKVLEKYRANHTSEEVADLIINTAKTSWPFAYDQLKDSDFGGSIQEIAEGLQFVMLIGILTGNEEAADFYLALLEAAGGSSDIQYEKVDAYKDTTVVLANMWLKGVAMETWKAGRTPLLNYEKQFVGIRPANVPTISSTNDMPAYTWDGDISIALNEKKTNGRLLRLSDPYLYFAYLSKFVFINDLALKKYDFDDVNVPHASESLTFSFNGHGISGSLISGSNYRDKSLRTLRDEMYAAWYKDWYYDDYSYYSDQKYPLPLYADEDWGLTGNNQTFIAPKYNKYVPNNTYYADGVGWVYPANLEADAHAGANLLRQFTAPYYIAEQLSEQMRKIAGQLVGIYNSASDLKKAMINWQNLHRGQYLKVSSEGFEVKVPYYQFPLIFGDCFSNGGRNFSGSIGSPSDKIGSLRDNQSTSNLFFYRLMGGTPMSYYTNTYQSAYNANHYVGYDQFVASLALKNVKTFNFKIYRTNMFNMSNNRYEYTADRGYYESPYSLAPSTWSAFELPGSGTFSNISDVMSRIGKPEVKINDVPVPDMVGVAVKDQDLLAWTQDNVPDLYAAFTESNNSKRIKKLQAWAKENDSKLWYWARENSHGNLWKCLLWNNSDLNTLLDEVYDNSVSGVGSKTAIKTQLQMISEPTVSVSDLKYIISHKYGIIW